MEKDRVAESLFGRLLRRHRLAAGLSQEALAERAQMSAIGVGALERGDRRYPYRETVMLLAEALGLTPAGTAELQTAAARPRRSSGRTDSEAVAGRGHLDATNLPSALTSLIGRATEVADIVRMLAESPLVTVTGAGGVGKTRTALAAGAALLEEGKAGVWLVELAAVTRGSFVAEAVARALNIQESPNRPLLETLVANLKRKSMLLILDNCEHVIAEAAELAHALLRECPQLRIVATSREPLRIAGEHAYRLPSLPVPSVRETPRLRAADAARFASVVLFIQRAQAIDYGFALRDDDAPIVGEICRRLDGIPLAIELAAARLNILSLRALRTKLGQRFRILAGGDRTVLPRHQTLRALIDWSYDLLDPSERELFERMATFAGGATLASLAALYADEIDELSVLTLVESLVDKSLVTANVGEIEPRYNLLESQRHYAYEKLLDRGDSQIIAKRHALVYLALAEDLERAYDSSPNYEWYARAEAELPNCRAALTWAFSEHGDVIVGQRLAAHLAPVWNLSYAEGERWIQAALESADDETPPHVRAHLEYAAAHVACLLDDFSRSLARGRRSLENYRAIGDVLGATRADYLIGVSLAHLGETVESRPFLERALTMARSLTNGRLAGLALRNLAYVRSAHGSFDEAREYAVQELEVWDSMDAPHHKALGLQNRARIEYNSGNIERAIETALLGLSTLREFGFGPSLLPYNAEVVADISGYLIAANRCDEARSYAREALKLAEETAHELLSLWSLQHLAASWILALGVQTRQSTSELADCASLLGYVDARLVELRGIRSPTNQLEYERLRRALTSVFSETVIATFAKAGAAMTCAKVMDIARLLARPDAAAIGPEI